MFEWAKKIIREIIADIAAQGILGWLKGSVLVGLILAIGEWLLGRSLLEIFGLLFVIGVLVFGFFELLARWKVRRSLNKAGTATEDLSKWTETTTTIREHHYSNETVEIDGKQFENCTFHNVTLFYKAIAAVKFFSPTWRGMNQLVTDNQGVKAFNKLGNYFKNLDNTIEISEGFIDKKGNVKIVTTFKKDQTNNLELGGSTVEDSGDGDR